jgi:hypothetical protein
VLTVSVLLCAYTEDRWSDIEEALDAVAGQSFAALEVILVVDHNPVLYGRARSSFPLVVVVENLGAKGLSGARNTGVAKARGDVIAFLDDDAVPEHDWLERLMIHYDDERTLGVGGHVEPAWYAARPGWFPEEFDWVVGCSYRGLPTRVSPLRNPIGANMSFRRFVLEQLGGFDSRVGRIGRRPTGCEETELCIRAHMRWPGSWILYEPAATVRHKVPPARSRMSYFVLRCWLEGQSKAEIASIRGSGQFLATERSYVTTILPRGVVAAARSTLSTGRPEGITRALSIILGLGLTAAGYSLRRLRLRLGSHSEGNKWQAKTATRSL